MTALHEIKELIESQGARWNESHAATAARLENLEEWAREIERKSGRPFAEADSWPTGASEDAERTKSFYSYMRTGRESDLQQKSMSIGSDPDGGYLVPTELDRELTKYLRARSPMRQIARVVQVGGAEFKQPFSTLGTAYSWVGETSARPETTAPGFKMLTIPTNEIYAMPSITQQLLDDNAFDLGAWLTEELGEAFGDGESDAFINGNGVARPRGLFTYTTVSTADATRAHDNFQYIPTGGAGAFASSNPSDALIALVYAVKPQYRANAVWLMSPEVLEAVRKFKSTSTDEYLWQPGTQAGQPATLLGYPVFEDENLPAIAANSLSAAFGDFRRAYTITDRSTGMLRDPYTSKPFVNFYATKRLGGGGGRDTRAVKFLKFASS
jgi:HK97 family phage major capsid protein